MPTSLALGKPLTGLVLAGLSRAGHVGQIVDVGPGAGVYAKLFSALTGPVKWSAVEAWEPYVDQFGLKDWYEQIIVGDVREQDFTAFGRIDVVLFGDVLEHMTRDEAVAVVAAATSAARFIILSIPLGHWPQDEIDGNPFEAHVEDDLTHQDVQALWPDISAGLGYVNNGGKGIGIYFIAADPADRPILNAQVDKAEAQLAGAVDLASTLEVDFLDETATAAFRDDIAALM